MEAIPSVQRPSIRIFTAVLASAGLGFLLASLFVFLACSGGYLFSGLDAIFSVIITTGFCLLGTSVTASLCRSKKIRFAWHTLVIEVSILAFVAIGLLSWLGTRQHLRIFMNPAPVPRGVKIYRGSQELFTDHIHFSASPVSIAKLIQSKGLIAVPEKPPETSDTSGFYSREQSKTSNGWWKPTTMTNPKFFFLHHQSDAIQGWSEGWWVNESTNEVYAFIGG